MSSWRRSLIPLVALSVALFLLAAVVATARVATVEDGAEPSDPAEAQATVQVLAGIKPRLQEFFAGNEASFTVAITNTGSVALSNIDVSGSPVPTCNQNNKGPLAPGQSMNYTCNRSNVTESFLNELIVTGTTADQVQDVHVTDAFVRVLKPEIRIVKRPTTQVVRQGATARFTVVVFNTSPDIVMTNVTVNDSAVDDCDFDPAIPLNLGPGESRDYSCQLTNVQAAVTSVATMEATNAETEKTVQASDAAWVEVANLTATLTPQPNSVPEPGELVTYTVNLVNNGSVPLTLTGLTTNQYGNILNAGNDKVDPGTNTCLPQGPLPTLAPVGGTYTCSFIAQASGQPSNFSVILTATARTKDNLEVTATTNATVQITNLPASVNLVLSAEPPLVPAPGGPVQYSVRIDNLSEADAVTITQMQDSLLGSLAGVGTCDVPVPSIPAGFAYQCSFTANVQGAAGDERTRTISVAGVDDDLTPETVSDSDSITVGITDRPIQQVFMPNVTDDIVEPNDSCSRAYPLQLNRQYFFFPPQPRLATGDQDVFSFTLAQSGDIEVRLTDFAPREGQLVVWAGECGALRLVGRNPDTALNKSVDLGTQAPGRYIVQLINDGPASPKMYGLIVRRN